MTMLPMGTMQGRDSQKVIKDMEAQTKALQKVHAELLQGKKIEDVLKDAESTLEAAREEAKEIRAKARKQAENVKKREEALVQGVRDAEAKIKEAQDKFKEAELIHAEAVKRSEVVEQKIAKFTESIAEMEEAKQGYHDQLEKLRSVLREFIG